MFLVLLSCLLLAKHIYSDTTEFAPCVDGSSTKATCTWSANLVQRDANSFSTQVPDESSPNIQGRMGAHDAFGFATTPHPSLSEADVEEEIAKPSAKESGEIHQVGNQSTFAASTRLSDDARFVSPPEQQGIRSEDALTKGHAESPPASLSSSWRKLHVNSDEARHGNDLEDASAKDTAGFSQYGSAWLLLVSQGLIVEVQGLQLPSGHMALMVLLISLISIIVVGAVIFLLSNFPSSEHTPTSLPEVEQSIHPYIETLATDSTVSSAHSGPHGSNTSLPLSCLGTPADNCLCPELLIPPASECTLVVPQLTSRILQEPEVTLPIQDTKGMRVFQVSLSRFTVKLGKRSHPSNPASYRLTFRSVVENGTLAYCEVVNWSREPGTRKNQRNTVVFKDRAGRYFAELEPCTEAGKEHHCIVSTVHHSHFYWRGTAPRTAVDSDGRLIATSDSETSDEPRHTLHGGPGVDMCLMLLSLISLDLLVEIG